MKRRKSKTRVKPRTSKLESHRRILRAILSLHRRMSKLERRERVIAGFSTDVVSTQEESPYRELEEIGDETELG